MAGGDYIPRPDDDFNTWQDNFVTYANGNLAALGLVAGDMTPVTAQQSTWKSALPAVQTALDAYNASVQAKDTSRHGFIASIRPVVNKIQIRPATTNAQRASLGITIPDTTHTAIPAPTTRPVVTVECGMPLQHTIGFRDESTPDSRGKPKGVLGAEVWAVVQAVGVAPPTREVMHMLGLDTKAPYLAVWESADIGKQAYYSLRWVNATGGRGPWSAIVSGLIGG